MSARHDGNAVLWPTPLAKVFDRLSTAGFFNAFR